jgi:hypothetical protein
MYLLSLHKERIDPCFCLNIDSDEAPQMEILWDIQTHPTLQLRRFQCDTGAGRNVVHSSHGRTTCTTSPPPGAFMHIIPFFANFLWGGVHMDCERRCSGLRLFWMTFLLTFCRAFIWDRSVFCFMFVCSFVVVNCRKPTGKKKKKKKKNSFIIVSVPAFSPCAATHHTHTSHTSPSTAPPTFSQPVASYTPASTSSRPSSSNIGISIPPVQIH